MKKITLLIILVVIAAVAYWLFTQQGIDTQEREATQPADGVEPVLFTISGTLSDVTNGDTVRGITTEGNADGIASAGFSNNQYNLEAVFNNLPEPQGTDFYEGWVVRRGVPLRAISTGKVEQEGKGVYSNIFTSPEDLTDHDFYVLTLEPDDGDPAPADHIVEGEMN